jgi:hypothetical protein
VVLLDDDDDGDDDDDDDDDDDGLYCSIQPNSQNNKSQVTHLY